jgi:hypothetical protein
VEVAEGNQWLKLTAWVDFKKLRRKQAKMPHEKRLQEDILFSLRYMSKKDLLAPPIPEVIAKAVQANDVKFFIRLGYLLSADPLKAEDYPVEQGETPDRNRLIKFLLSHWAEPRDGLPELFYLTPESLALVCNHCLGVKHHSADALVKPRQRLKLLPFKRCKLHARAIKGKLRFFP